MPIIVSIITYICWRIWACVHKKHWKKEEYTDLIEKGILKEVERRESLGEVNLVEEREAKYQPGILIISEEGEVNQVYYVDSFGEYHDEITGKLLPKQEVIKARLDEMCQIRTHAVYDKVPIEECYIVTGKKPIQTKWLDINKGDEDNPEYRSRLVAKEIKSDNRLDLFAATPPLEAKKLLFRFAVTEGIGYLPGERESGMKIDFIW